MGCASSRGAPSDSFSPRLMRTQTFGASKLHRGSLIPLTTSLAEILLDNDLRRMFYQFAVQRYSEEHVSFLVAHDNLKLLESSLLSPDCDVAKTQLSIRGAATRMLKTYILPDAHSALNISNSTLSEAADLFYTRLRPIRVRRKTFTNQLAPLHTPWASPLPFLSESSIFTQVVDEVVFLLEFNFRVAFLNHLSHLQDKRQSMSIRPRHKTANPSSSLSLFSIDEARASHLSTKGAGSKSMSRLLPRVSSDTVALAITPRTPRVVIVGGGTCGVYCANVLSSLSTAIVIVVVEPKDYYEFKPSLVAGICEPASFERACIPLRAIFPANVTHLRATVDKVTKKFLVLDDAQIVAFDYLVLAPGALHSLQLATGSAVSRSHRLQQIKTCNAQVAQACYVACLGRSFLATELAVSIREKWKFRRVTLTHACKKTPGLNEVNGYIRQIGVVCLHGPAAHLADVTGASIESCAPFAQPTSTEYLAPDARPADEVFVCGETTPATAFLRDSFLFPSVTPSGTLRVSDKLEVANAVGVFSGGSAAEGDRSWQTSRLQGTVIAGNILCAIYPGLFPPRTYRADKYTIPFSLQLGRAWKVNKVADAWVWQKTPTYCDADLTFVTTELTGDVYDPDAMLKVNLASNNNSKTKRADFI